MKAPKLKEPKLRNLILTATSGISLGALLGIFYLLAMPVNVVSKMPDADVESKPGDLTTHYAAGRTAAMETPNARSAVSRIQRRSPGPVSFSEEELNYYFGKMKADAPAETEENPGSEISQFNVRISGDQMVAGFRLVIDPKGDRFEMMVQANVGFENTEEGPQLTVDGVRLNSLPIPGMGGILSSMIESKIAEAEWPDEYVEMWNNIRNIEIESGAVITEVGLRRA